MKNVPNPILDTVYRVIVIKPVNAVVFVVHSQCLFFVEQAPASLPAILVSGQLQLRTPFSASRGCPLKKFFALTDLSRIFFYRQPREIREMAFAYNVFSVKHYKAAFGGYFFLRFDMIHYQPN